MNEQPDNQVLINPESQVNLNLIISYKFNGDIQIMIPGISVDKAMARFIGNSLVHCGQYILNVV